MLNVYYHSFLIKYPVTIGVCYNDLKMKTVEKLPFNRKALLMNVMVPFMEKTGLYAQLQTGYKTFGIHKIYTLEFILPRPLSLDETAVLLRLLLSNCLISAQNILIICKDHKEIDYLKEALRDSDINFVYDRYLKHKEDTYSLLIALTGTERQITEYLKEKGLGTGFLILFRVNLYILSSLYERKPGKAQSDKAYLSEIMSAEKTLKKCFYFSAGDIRESYQSIKNGIYPLNLLEEITENVAFESDWGRVIVPSLIKILSNYRNLSFETIMNTPVLDERLVFYDLLLDYLDNTYEMLPVKNGIALYPVGNNDKDRHNILRETGYRNGSVVKLGNRIRLLKESRQEDQIFKWDFPERVEKFLDQIPDSFIVSELRLFLKTLLTKREIKDALLDSEYLSEFRESALPFLYDQILSGRFSFEDIDREPETLDLFLEVLFDLREELFGET